jgi:hypothetical protein
VYFVRILSYAARQILITEDKIFIGIFIDSDMEDRTMKYRKSLVILSVLCLILSGLGLLGLVIHGKFEQFVNGATPGVLAGLSLLMLIFLRKDEE